MIGLKLRCNCPGSTVNLNSKHFFHFHIFQIHAHRSSHPVFLRDTSGKPRDISRYFNRYILWFLFVFPQIMCLSVFVEGKLYKDINTIKHKYGHVVLISNMFVCQKDTRQGSIEGSSIGTERAPARFGCVYLSKCHVLTTASTLGEI